jgi:hypothetical protein
VLGPGEMQEPNEFPRGLKRCRHGNIENHHLDYRKYGSINSLMEIWIDQYFDIENVDQ